MRLKTRGLTEKEWMQQVVTLARLKGWLCYHTHDSRRSEPGFPDLVLVKAGHPVIFAELKTEKGRVMPSQAMWLETLRAAVLPPNVHVWRPADWEMIVEVLSLRKD